MADNWGLRRRVSRKSAAASAGRPRCRRAQPRRIKSERSSEPDAIAGDAERSTPPQSIRHLVGSDEPGDQSAIVPPDLEQPAEVPRCGTAILSHLSPSGLAAVPSEERMCELASGPVELIEGSPRVTASTRPPARRLPWGSRHRSGRAGGRRGPGHAGPTCRRGDRHGAAPRPAPCRQGPR